MLLLGLTSCSYIKNVNLLTGGEIKRKNFVQTIPFELRKDLIVVKAFINNDSIEREFIFDTGAFNSKVESKLADNLELQVVTQKTNSTAQGVSKKIDVMRVDSIRLGETYIYNAGAGKVVYEANSASPCIAANGIIGANIIKLAHWKIDFKNKLLHFSDKPFETHPNSLVLPFDKPLLSGTPSIDLEINGKEVQNVLFDLGFNGGLVLPRSVAHHFESEHTQVLYDQSTSGIYGTNTDTLIVKSLELNIDGFKTHIPIEFSSLNKALLGNEFLKHFVVTINYDKNEINLQNQQKVTVESPKLFIAGIKNDSLWTVNRTSANLPFTLGEPLLSVNGKKPHELFSSYCDYIMNINSLLDKDSLVVEKMNGQIKTILIN